MKLRKLRNKRSRLIKECDALMFRYLKLKRGEKCEICGKTKYIGPFHILPKSTAPRLRFSEENLLLVCWPCHYIWHHDFFKAKAVEIVIKKLRGEDYEQKLRNLNAIAPRLKTFELEKIKFGLTEHINLKEAKHETPDTDNSHTDSYT